MVTPFLISPFFIEYILPLILVFTLLFAVFEKTKLLGEESKRINATIALVISLIFIAFPFAKSIVVLLMPFLAVSVVILLVFMLLYGFIGGKKDGDVLSTGWKIVFAIILAIGLVCFLLIITGYWDFVWYFMFGTQQGYTLWLNGILIIAIAGGIIAVLKGDKS